MSAHQRLWLVSWIVVAAIACIASPARAQIDDRWTVKVAGQTVTANADGSFTIANIAVPDFLPATGMPDFLSDDAYRLTGTAVIDGVTYWVYSDCFRIAAGQTFTIAAADLTFSETPPAAVLIDQIVATPATPTLTSLERGHPGNTTQINLVATMADGTPVAIPPGDVCPTYRTSNKQIASVVSDGDPGTMDGVVTAVGAGTALITTTLEGAAHVTPITVSPGDLLTTVVGIVQSETGDPVVGATVTVIGFGNAGMTSSKPPGQFMIEDVPSLLGPIAVLAQGTVDGQLHFGGGVLTPPVPGGYTDVGLVTLDDNAYWVANQDGFWHINTNWTVLPNSSLHAVIDVPANITVTHSQGTTVVASLQSAENFALTGGSFSVLGLSFVMGLFTHSGGSLSGAGTLTSDGLYNWTGGNMEGGGTTVLNSGLTLSNTVQLYGRTITNANNGTFNWTGGQLNIAAGSVIDNQPGSTFEVQTDADFVHNGGAFSTFNNAGTLRKSAGTATTTLGGTNVNNSGTIEVNVGTLQIGGGDSSGLYSVASGAALEFFSGTNTITGQTDVEGTLRITGGSTNFDSAADTSIASLLISSGSVSFAGAASAASIAQSGGTLSGGGTLTSEGLYNWTGGNMEGGGTTLLNGGLTLSNTVQLYGRTLTNANNGTFNWTGGQLNIAAGSVIDNQPGSTFEVQTDADFVYNGGASSNFNNFGTLRKSAGSGTTTLGGTNVNNSGTIEVNVGTLQMGGGTSSGIFNVASGATLDFASIGSAVQTTMGAVTVDGTLRFSGGTTNLNGSTVVTGQIEQTGGTGNFSDSADVSASSLSISGGTVTFAGSASAASVSHSGGTLSGTGTLTSDGLYNWTGGNMEGGGTTVLNSGLTLSNTVQLYGRTITNANNGTFNWTGGQLNIAAGSVIDNQPGSTFEVQTDADFVHNGGAFSTFNNAGTLRKSAGTATTTLGGTNVNNSGTIEVNVGTLQIGGGDSSGLYSVASGAALEFFSGTNTITGQTDVEGTLRITGGSTNFDSAADTSIASLLISSGSVSFAGAASAASIAQSGGTLSGGGTLTSEGLYNWTGGNMEGGGTTLLNGGLTLSNTVQLYGRTLTNANNGTFNWTGGQLNIAAGSVIDNQPGSTFEVQTDADFVYNGGASSNFNNFGTLRKSAGSGATLLSGINLINSGTVEVMTGTLDLPTYSQSAGSTVLADGSLSSTSTLQINGGTIGLAAGTSSGTITGSVTLGNAAASTVPRPGAAGTLTITGTYTQNAGTLDIELGGTAGGGFDVLAVGTAALGGTLKLTLINGFVPNVGDMFQVVVDNAAPDNITGTFGPPLLVNFPANLGASVSVTASAVTVTITGT